MNPWLAAFESIGENCEFGFVQEKLGGHEDTLLRWALSDSVEATSVAIRNLFEGVFAFENLRPAHGGTMVRDVTAGIAFRTAMQSELRHGIWCFVTPDSERRRVHARELQTFLELRQKFRCGLVAGERIYVATGSDGLTDANAEALLASIAEHGAGRLLYVTTADDRHAPGSVERVHARLAHGRVDRFAPCQRPDDVSAACWETLLRTTAALFGADTRGSDRAPHVPPAEPHLSGAVSDAWTAYTPVAPADVSLVRALAAAPAPGDLVLEERPRRSARESGAAFYDDAYFAAAYPELADAAALKVERETDTEDYGSPAMRALGARLRDATDPEYIAVCSVPEQIEALRRMFAPSLYARLLGWPAGDPAMLWAHYLAHGLPAGVPPTPLFNPAYYRRQIAARGLQPPHAGEPLVLHWLRVGAGARVVPTRMFDEAFYMAAYPEVAGSEKLGYWHYLVRGMNERRAPTPWFDLDWYRSLDDETEGERYDHFIAVGMRGGRTPSPLVADIMRRLGKGMPFTAQIHTALVEISHGWGGRLLPDGVNLLTNLYVPQWHRSAAAPLDGFLDYLRDGIRAGARPGPLFDEAIYRQRAVAAGLPPPGPDGSAFEHWLYHGLPARIVPTERFDEVGYLATYPDIAGTGFWGFGHFVNSGLAEGRGAPGRVVHTFFCRNALTTAGDDAMPTLLRYWHALDFPDDAGGVDQAGREADTEDYGSPAMRALGARLRDATDPEYIAVSSVPEQIEALRRMFAPSLYARLLGWPADDPAMLWAHYLAHGLPAGVPPTPLFNPAYYRRQIAAHGLQPPHAGEPLVLHWLRVGAEAMVVPTGMFDEAFYMAAYPEVAGSEKLGYWHYLVAGINERRAPTPWFDLGWYRSLDDETSGERYDHFIAVGIREGRTPSPLVADIMRRLGKGMPFTAQIHTALLEISHCWGGRLLPDGVNLLTNLYVPQWHRSAAAPLDGFLNYLRDGIRAGTRPGPLFDEAIYRQRAVAAGLPLPGPDESAFEHWLYHGLPARIVPTERFDEAGYLAKYPDIAGTGFWGFGHFVNLGLAEGREAPVCRIPMFRCRNALTSADDDAMPTLLRYWYTLDFPDDTSGVGGEITAAAHRRLQELLNSEQLAEIFAEAQAIDPMVGEIATIDAFVLPPLHDDMPLRHAEIRKRLPSTHYDSIVCVPWIQTGGADLVAGLLAKSLLRARPNEKVLVLRTDQPHFERGDWLPAEADVVDISDQTAAVPPDYAEELLRTVLRGVTARRVFNVNSRLCWITLRDHGKNIAATLRVYAYMFAWDLTPSGVRVGYPAEFYAMTANIVTAYLTDTTYLRDELTRMYRLPGPVRDRIVPMFTPAQTKVRVPSIARIVEDRAAPASRRLVLWAGRLDRQKRFDLVQEIARLIPDVTFRCWGAPLLDAPPDLTDLPPNMRMEGSFDSFDDLPLAEAGAWLFTALWEGMPTTIIELAVRGVPIVASSVGGVPELIGHETGWPVPATASAEDYAAALRDALSSPAEATRRAEALQRRVADTYNEAVYDAALQRLLAAEDAT